MLRFLVLLACQGAATAWIGMLYASGGLCVAVFPFLLYFAEINHAHKHTSLISLYHAPICTLSRCLQYLPCSPQLLMAALLLARLLPRSAQ